MSGDGDELTRFRLQALEEAQRSLGTAVGQVVRLDAELDGLAESVDKLDKTHTHFRVEMREEFKALRKDLADDRHESRNRTLLALGPIALAALAIFAKVVIGVDLPGAH